MRVTQSRERRGGEVEGVHHGVRPTCRALRVVLRTLILVGSFNGETGTLTGTRETTPAAASAVEGRPPG